MSEMGTDLREDTGSGSCIITVHLSSSLYSGLLLLPIHVHNTCWYMSIMRALVCVEVLHSVY